MARGRRLVSLALGCALVLGAALTGCDAGDSSEGSPSASTSASPTDPTSEPTGSAAPQQPVELTFAVYGDDEVVAAYQRIADRFSAQADQVDIEVVSYPDAVSAADAVAAADGSGQGPDVFLLDQLQLPRLVAAGALAAVVVLLIVRGRRR